jgi:subtilisin family serine protease
MEEGNNDYYTYQRELQQDIIHKGLTPEEANKYYTNDEYSVYFVEYIGDLAEAVNATDYAKAFIISTFFAIVFVKDGMLSEFLKNFPEVVNIERNFPFTLLDLNQSGELPDLKAISKGNVPLDGEGIIVGIVGTGIDYLNPRFMDEKGDTRIVSIFDQTLTRGPFPNTQIYGTEFTKDEINNAIKTNLIGENPYNIVQHKDENGYGTAIAGIVGSRKLNKDDLETSVAPKCEFAIVKLRTTRNDNLKHWGLEKYKDIVYDSDGILSAGRYLYQVQQKTGKPVVMYVPAGTNQGSHDGRTITERFFDYLGQGRKFSIVMSTGNQGGSPICYKGNFFNEGDVKEININIDKNQGNIFFTLYFKAPDKISIGITSPIGESIDKLNINFIDGEEVTSTLGGSSIYVQYLLHPKSINNQRLDFVIKNATAGVWKINIKKEYIIYGEYNLWLQQKEFSVGNTGLLEYTPYTTLMTPSTANHGIVTSSYDQVASEIMEESGRGFTVDNRIIPSVTLSSRNILTTSLNNKPTVVSGTAASGAILAGVVALLFQWGIVGSNDINMYASKIKTYLIQGTTREEKKVYPNPKEGFGVLNIEKLFTEIIKRGNSQNLYVSIPRDIYSRLNNRLF